ncbi:hypothetical protein MPTK1_7g06800 [Marchantia polymorpha subsp. ruderalis]|uniref:Uncharacterized protein n=2 Tax=Marchantia polymorpha TaxID=3197 RepID=A0AAF6BWW0_MARPO|nr:hypothetical protein MARPO_0199s0011 [Marchantia polymorpha]BBN16494.1 hypothetical protein Mp_7g06800 [Marchantia polymorpha subsp. ruderalis]|eukprot:PTQ27421.1 hypothetical protein MARPO_0199s0011 [Marchantia polymorpha]
MFLCWGIFGVCSPTVRIIAFQAIDPGSTPGRRRITQRRVPFLHGRTLYCTWTGILDPVVCSGWSRDMFDFEISQVCFLHVVLNSLGTILVKVITIPLGTKISNAMINDLVIEPYQNKPANQTNNVAVDLVRSAQFMARHNFIQEIS